MLDDARFRLRSRVSDRQRLLLVHGDPPVNTGTGTCLGAAVALCAPQSSPPDPARTGSFTLYQPGRLPSLEKKKVIQTQFASFFKQQHPSVWRHSARTRRPPPAARRQRVGQAHCILFRSSVHWYSTRVYSRSIAVYAYTPSQYWSTVRGTVYSCTYTSRTSN